MNFPKSRTTVGYGLWEKLCRAGKSADEAAQEIDRRVQVRTARVNEDTIQVWTSLDGGEWVDEGRYAD